MYNIEINDLTTKDTDNVIEIFSTAFENYPLMEFIFGDSYKQSIKHLIQFICDRASEGNSFLVGAFLKKKLQGVASITPAQNGKNDRNIESTKTASEEKFATAIGEKLVRRIEAYYNIKKANEPSSPHFYINTFAVHPQSQGKGIGSAILSQVHHMSEQHSDSQGVALDTQTQKNVGYYQRFGYGVFNTVQLENVKNWFMFRPN